MSYRAHREKNSDNTVRRYRADSNYCSVRAVTFGRHLLADDDVLGASADVADDAAAPDELAATPDGRRAPILVVATATAQRFTVGLSQPPPTDGSHLSAGPSDAASTVGGRTVVGRPVDVDQLVLPQPPATVVPLLPLPSPSPSPSFPAATSNFYRQPHVMFPHRLSWPTFVGVV